MSSKQRYFLFFSLLFYLLAQAFQQFVFLIGPLKGVNGLASSVVAGQHTLNYVRHYLIYASMVLMIPGYIILVRIFYPSQPFPALMAGIFFILFCFIEIAHRSIHIFVVMDIWGMEHNSSVEGIVPLPEKFITYFHVVHAIYFPLLLCLLLGSFSLLVAALRLGEWLVVVAMAVSALQQASRLSGYLSLEFLDMFDGIWYFILVAIQFSLLIWWVLLNQGLVVGNRLPKNPQPSKDPGQLG